MLYLVAYFITRDPIGEAEKMHAYLEMSTSVARCEITFSKFGDFPYITAALIGEAIDRKVYFVKNKNQAPSNSRLFDQFGDIFAWMKGKDNSTRYWITAPRLPSLNYHEYSEYSWTVPTSELKHLIVPEIKRIEQNLKNSTFYTTVIWADGSKPTVVKCAENDSPDFYFAVASAIVIKMYGSNSAYKRMINEKIGGN